MAKSLVYLRRHKLKLLMLLVLCSIVCHLLILGFSSANNSNSVLLQTFSLTRLDKRNGTSDSVASDYVNDLRSSVASDYVNGLRSWVASLNALLYTGEWQNSFSFIYSNGGSSPPGVTDENNRYVMVLPFSKIEEKAFNHLAEDDKLSLLKLYEFLDVMVDFDGATCLQPSTEHKRADHELHQEKLYNQMKDSLESSWCRFITKKWSLHIKNTGPVLNTRLERKTSTNGSSSNKFSFPDLANGILIVYQVCNVAQGPFVMRGDVFHRYGGLLNGFGRMALLEFFVRSKGELKIAKLSNCSWTHEIARVDRGTLEGSNDVPEYAAFGNKFNILRIVTNNRIEWTTCVSNWKLCPEKPYVKPTELSSVAAPICCGIVLFQMLKDITWALTQLGVDYRVIYGTLLGAVRSQTVIPWTCDVDIALTKADYGNSSTYSSIAELLRTKGSHYYLGISYMGMPRGHMLMAPYIEVDTASLFDGPDDLEGNNLLFSSDIEQAVQGMLPVSSGWRERRYVDFYISPSVWLNGSAFATINNEQFVTLKDIDYELTNWYGKGYLQPAHGREWFGCSD